MSSIIVSGDTSGAITLAAPAVAGTTTINLPATSGTMTVTASGLTSGRVTYAGAGGLLQDSSNLTFNGTTLTSAGFSGPLNGTVGATTPSTGAFTTLTTSSTVTLNGGTANGVAYLDGSKVLTSGSALIWTGATQKLGFQNAAANGYGYIYNAGAGTNTDLGFEVGGTEQMRLTSTGLGIGTSSPSSKLQVANGALTISDATTHAFLKISPNSGSAAFLDIPTVGSSLLIRTSASSTTDTNSLTITSSGNVNIGSSAYTRRLSVKDTTNTVVVIEGSNSGSSNINFADSDSENPGSINYSHATNYMAFQTAGTERMRIDSSGNVGIGMTPSSGWRSVDRVLQIQSSGVIRGQTNANLIDLGSNYYINNSNLSVYIASDYASRFTQYQGVFSWESAASGTAGNTITWTERMRITSGGYFKASDAGSYVGSTAAYHEIVGSSTLACVIKTTYTGGNRDVALLRFGNNPNNTSSSYIYCDGDAGSTGLKMTVYSNGGIANYQANDANLSDLREKTNFAPAKSYLDAICAIPVQTFNYIDQNLEEDAGLTLGVVAQDVQAVAPELVMESDWAGEDEEPKMRLSIYQTDLQYALMKCIQELKADNDDLRARIAALEAQ